jgi:hypothetical protein
MNKAVWLAKHNYWIAAIGAIVSVVSFLGFTFLDISTSISLPNFGPGPTPSPLPTSVSLPVSAILLAYVEGILWVSLVLVVAVLGVSLVFLVRRYPFGSRAPVQTQARWTALGFVIAAVLSAVCLVASFLLVQQRGQDLLQNVTGTPLGSLGSSFSDLFHLNFTWGVGAYLFLAGLVVIVVAGIMEIIRPVKLQSDAEMAATLNAPQNPYNYPSPVYGSTPMNQGAPPFANAPTQYGGNPASGGQPYPSAPNQQPPAGPYQ